MPSSMLAVSMEPVCCLKIVFGARWGAVAGVLWDGEVLASLICIAGALGLAPPLPPCLDP